MLQGKLVPTIMEQRSAVSESLLGIEIDGQGKRSMVKDRDERLGIKING